MPYERHITYNDRKGQELALAAIAGFPSLDQAKEFLSDQGYGTTVRALEVMRDNKAQEYETIRAELAPAIEAHIANDALDVAHLCTEIEKLAGERLLTAVKEGRVSRKEMSRIMRDVSQTKSQSIEKRMTLEDRPEKIVSHRSHDEVIDGLVRLKVAQVVDATAIEEESGA